MRLDPPLGLPVPHDVVEVPRPRARADYPRGAQRPDLAVEPVRVRGAEVPGELRQHVVHLVQRAQGARRQVGVCQPHALLPVVGVGVQREAAGLPLQVEDEVVLVVLVGRPLQHHPRARGVRAVPGKRDSIHRHLLEVISETATVPELRQKLLYTTPSGWWWCIESVSRVPVRRPVRVVVQEDPGARHELRHGPALRHARPAPLLAGFLLGGTTCLTLLV